MLGTGISFAKGGFTRVVCFVFEDTLRCVWLALAVVARYCIPYPKALGFLTRGEVKAYYSL